jgi:hypothetical protein
MIYIEIFYQSFGFSNFRAAVSEYFKFGLPGKLAPHPFSALVKFGQEFHEFGDISFFL